MVLITRLWQTGNLYIRDGLYRADGTSWAVRCDSSLTGGLLALEMMDLESLFQSDPSNVTSIDVTCLVRLHDNSGFLFCGEGSFGSEGIFGRLDQSKGLVWVVYLERANPFIEVTINDCLATFKSSSGVLITVDLGQPQFGPFSGVEKMCNGRDFGSLSSMELGTLTPFEFLRTIQEELGISFVETRDVLQYFDPEMRPIVDMNVIDECWQSILRKHHLI